MQHPTVEFQPGQLPVQEPFRRVQVKLRGNLFFRLIQLTFYEIFLLIATHDALQIILGPWSECLSQIYPNP
jgi:hypothetical protein